MSDPGSLILLVLAGALLVFMMFSSRKRMTKMRAEQEAKQRQTVPGAEVLLQSGIYGTIISFDPDDLDKAVEVEIAPGIVIKAHSQAILRVITPEDETELTEAPAIENIETPLEAPEAAPSVESVDETRRRLDNNG